MLSLEIHAQYTGVINANNPGFSETPYSVGLGVYQLESNFFSRNTSIEPVFSSPDSYGIHLQYRMSYFFEELEFQANLGLQRDQIAFENLFTSSYHKTNLSTLSLGAKYFLFEQPLKDKTKEIRSWKKRHAFDFRRLIPSVAVFGGFNTNLVGEIHKRQSITGRLGVLLQNDINNDVNIITNAFYDYIGSNQAELSLVVSGTYSFTDRWSTFLEYQNIFREFVNDVNFGTGLAYLYDRNLQINSSLRYLIEGDAKGYYVSVGFSYRLDRHVDSLVEYDDLGNKKSAKNEDPNSLKPKKGIGKVLSNVNVFKKDASKKKIQLSKETIESIERNLNVDDKTLYQTRKAKGLPVRTRPIRVRKKVSRYRPVKTKKDTSAKDDAKAKKELERENKEKEKARRRAEKEADRILKRQAKQKEKEEQENDNNNLR